MFKKSIKIKSNTQTKASERKQLKDLLLSTFPMLSENDINELIPKKEGINCLKIITSDNVILQVYVVQRRPLIFDLRGKIFPTIFLLWRFPGLIYSFITHEQVMTYISSGADLMLPGVLTPPNHTGLSKYGNVSENDIVSVSLSKNKAPVAVGVACQSSNAMHLANGRGKCVNILHFYGDNLCNLEGAAIPQVPNLGTIEWLSFVAEDFPELGRKQGASSEQDRNVLTEQNQKSSEDCNDQNNIENDDFKSENIDNVGIQSEDVDDVEDMDELLMFCFLGAIKYSKSLALPALISNFFKLHMLPICPSHKTLDIKKTSFKKLKPFLEKMAGEGLIMVKEIKKGVEAITIINKDHPKFTEFYLDPDSRPKKEANENEPLQKTDVVESYIITQNVLPIFEKSGLKKGDIVQTSDVRKYVTNYVKVNNLQDATNSRLLIPKDALVTICKTENLITWEEVIEKVCDSMKSCYKVKSGHDEILNKGKVSPITISVSVRSGNKKVTLVDNLELFGINLNEFSKECQHGVAASTTIIKPPSKKSDQLLVQGNQVLFVYNLLVEKYKIPKKYVKGLENAPKKKK